MATLQPHNTSEWQLYRVLQRANLLQYYDTFIAQGKIQGSHVNVNLKSQCYHYQRGFALYMYLIYMYCNFYNSRKILWLT